MVNDLIKMIKLLFHPDPCCFCERNADDCLKSEKRESSSEKSKSAPSRDRLKTLGRSMPCGN